MFKKKWVKRLFIILGSIVLLYGVIFAANVLCNVSLRKYIESFDPVSYGEQRIVPKMEDGHYTITTDEDLRIMHVTDIHIGGGIFTIKNDRKSIYELITMLQKEAPDIVICGGDNTYCLIPLGFNGGGTFNNKMVAKTFISIFEHEKVYFTTVFGNHDTESMDYASRQEIADLYMDPSYKYCFFNEEFTDQNAETVPSVSNQFIVVKGTDGTYKRLVLLMDSNAYEDTHFFTAVFGKYDVIHDSQVLWAQDEIKSLSKKAGLPDNEVLKTTAFMHIPIGEYRTALDDLITEERNEKGKLVGFKPNENPKDTEYVSGFWGEEKICYGGLYRKDDPKNLDNFFEVLCDQLGSVDGIFSGHDHVNNAVVKYRGVILDYGYSIDNEAYGDKIMKSGLQRGATIITIHPDGSFSEQHKNAYKDYGVSTEEFVPVYLDHYLYPDMYRAID